MKMSQLERDFESCRLIQKKFGKSYYFSTLFFPKDIKIATHVLYAFFRVPDEIVDSNPDETLQDKKRKLEEYKTEWRNAYNNSSDNSVLRASAFIFKKYNIPFEYSESFLDAMISDTYISRYSNYEEVKKYMYGSAAAVGLIMSHVIGFTDKGALAYAEKLGYAMQLTNFLRDIKEDYDLRGRIYLPQDEMTRFGITEENIRKHECNQGFVDFMKFQIDRARNLYKEADAGIAMLNKSGQLPVKIASVLYASILDKIEDLQYDVYIKRARISFFKRIYLAFLVIIKK